MVRRAKEGLTYRVMTNAIGLVKSPFFVEQLWPVTLKPPARRLNDNAINALVFQIN